MGDKHDGPNELVDALGFLVALVLALAAIMGIVFLGVGLVRRFLPFFV